MTEKASNSSADFDYSFVGATARVALYDDLKSAPRITKIEPAVTADFIEHLTTCVYEQSKLAGGKIPYSVIREVSENFIHAQFREIVVSILDEGNTIRFADQGPGILEKDKAKKPGFTSATEPMKDFIRGVGSGFPIVCDYLGDRDGSLIIEDNLSSGAVVTITLMKSSAEAPYAARQVPTQLVPHIPLTNREREFLSFLLSEGDLGITEMGLLAGTASSTTHATFKKLEQSALVENNPNKKRSLTDLGYQVATSL